jgi:hypothetical protein
MAPPQRSRLHFAQLVGSTSKLNLTGDEIMSRISAERMAKAQEQLKTISKEDHAKVKAVANIVRPLRSFIFKTMITE